MFQAMLSVMAVKIQLSSPSGVLRSVCFPGILSMSSFVSPSAFSSDLEQNHLFLLAFLSMSRSLTQFPSQVLAIQGHLCVFEIYCVHTTA